jgi:hypothetical protein
MTYIACKRVLRFSIGYRMSEAKKPPVAPEKESMNTSKIFSKLL